MTSKLHPYLAIDKPVPPLPIDSGGELCFKIEARWLPYIVTLLKTFLHDRTWQSDTDRCVKEGHNLISQFILQGECEPGVISTDHCVAFSPAAPFIDWNPQDPYTQPDYIPPGYLNPPFFIWPDPPPSSITFGLHTGDVTTGIFGFPVGTPVAGTGLARFRVNLVGAGTVELHFVSVVLGSLALVVPDDNILKIVEVDLNLGIDQFPPETNVEVVSEVTFDTPGAHHIDVTFVPQVRLSEDFLSYGGGLRSVVLCGFDEMTSLYTIRQKPTDPCKLEQTVDGIHWTQIADITKCTGVHQEPGGNIVITIGDLSFSLFGTNTSLDTGLELDADMKIRKKPTDECVLQLECAPGEWTDWYDPRSCVPGSLAQPTNGGALAAGECREWDVVLSGKDKWLLPVQVNTGDTIQVTGASGAWNDGTLLWFCPSGQLYLHIGCGGDAAAESGDPITSLNHMRLIENIDGVAWVDAYNTIYAVQTGVSDGTIYFQANDGSLSDNSGTISFHVKVCKPDDAVLPVGITYAHSSGVSSIVPGNYLTINSACCGGGGGSDNAVHVAFDRPVKITVVAQTGFNLVLGGCGVGCLWSNIQNPAGTLVATRIDSDPHDPLTLPPTVGVVYELDSITSGTDFSVTLLIENP